MGQVFRYESLSEIQEQNYIRFLMSFSSLFKCTRNMIYPELFCPSRYQNELKIAKSIAVAAAAPLELRLMVSFNAVRHICYIKNFVTADGRLNGSLKSLRKSINEF